MMKFKIIICCISMLTLIPSMAQTFTKALVFNGFLASTRSIDSLKYIDYTSNALVTNDFGLPAFPYVTERIAIPNGFELKVSSFVKEADTLMNVRVLPALGNKKLTDKNTLENALVHFNQLSINYPTAMLDVFGPNVQRSEIFSVLKIIPFQYNPINNSLVVIKKLDLVYEFVQVTQPILPLNFTDPVQPFRRDFKDKSSFKEIGKMLIIGDSTLFYSSIFDLMYWNNQKGIETHFIDVTKIGSSAEQIKSFISSYYTQNPDLVYILLLGDHDKLPPYTYGNFQNDEYWSDNYYGQLIGNDIYPELIVGRLSTNDPIEMKSIVKKIVSYQKDDLTGDWVNKAIGLASNQGDGIGDDNEPDWLHSRNLRKELLSSGYSFVYEFYDGDHGDLDKNGNPVSKDIVSAVNQGIGLFNYTGHGDNNVCFTGYLFTTDIKGLTNYGKYPVFNSVACNNGAFMYGDCISEMWLKTSNSQGPTGAVAATGSSILMDWAPPMETQDNFVYQLTHPSENSNYTIGGMFFNAQNKMHDKYPGDLGKATMLTWIFFGDPSVPFRSKTLATIQAAHLNVFDESNSTFKIQSNCLDGRVVLSQNGTILANSTLNEGKIELNVTSEKIDPTIPIDVVITKFNHKPYIGQIIPKSSFSGEIEVTCFPNPASNNFMLKSSDVVESVSIFDVNGSIVFSDTPEIAGTFSFETRNWNAGFYFVQVKTANSSTVFKQYVSH